MYEAEHYELSELIDEANRLREADPLLTDTTPFNARTVYYYVQEGLLPGRSGRRGPGTRYPKDFLYRLLLIRRLQKEKALTLSHIREVMERISPDTLRSVALGDEPITIRSIDSVVDAKAHAEIQEEALILHDREPEYPMFDDEALDDSLGDESNDYRAPAIPVPPPNLSPSVPLNRPTQKHRFPLGQDAELVVNKTITAKQARQLQHIVHLLEEILSEDADKA